MRKTGVFLTEDDFEKVQDLLRPLVSIFPETGITITSPPDKEAAWKILEHYAECAGLPPLPEGQTYGLTSDRELIY